MFVGRIAYALQNEGSQETCFLTSSFYFYRNCPVNDSKRSDRYATENH